MSLVLELQQAINSNEKVSDLLTKAYMIAKKLDQKDIIEWLDNEITGYNTNTNPPDYRIIQTTYKAWNPYNGWIPYIIPENMRLDLETELGHDVFILGIFQSIKQIEEIYIANETIASTNNLSKYFSNLNEFNLQVYSIVTPNSLLGILNHVKKQLLDWALELENQGILGENITFTKEDKKKAKAITPIINNTINNYGNNSNIQAGGNNNTIESNNDFTVTKQANFQTKFNELKDLINQHQELSNNEDIQEDIHDITKQLEKPTPRPNKIINACNNILPLVKNIPTIAKVVTSLLSLLS